MLRVISIDIGLNNLAAITNNIGQQPLLIKGKRIKAENQWYNKVTQPLRCRLEHTADTKEKEALNKQIQRTAANTVKHITAYFKEVCDWIIGYCVDNRIDVLLIGEYQILEKENFISVPFEYLYTLLETQCKYYNITYKTVNEKYTSGTSFFDNEPPTKEFYNKSRRILKHLWECNDGRKVNADVNDSYQIMRKAYPEFFTNGVKGYKRDPKVIEIGGKNNDD